MKNQKGITLVALVITIIVLLILAGVSISLVVGQNGVLGKAQSAVKAQKEAEVKQAISLAVNSADAYWGSKFATNASYTRGAAYDDADNGVIKEMDKQGYTVTTSAGSNSVVGTATWTITSKTNASDVFTASVTLDGSTGQMTITSCTIKES